MTCETFQPGQYVFKLGDEGSTFYVILKGSAGVLIPDPQAPPRRATDPQQFREVKVLTAGEAFGELAILKGKPRAATIICKDECIMAVLERNHYNIVLRNKQRNELLAKINFLATAKLLSFLPLNKLTELFYNSEVEVPHMHGSIVYHEGSPSKKLYLIKSGEFTVLKTVRRPVHSSPIPKDIPGLSDHHMNISIEVPSHATPHHQSHCISSPS
jgi:cAMP-dependent protein kinase regulator